MSPTILDRELDLHRDALSGCRACGDRVGTALPIVSLARRPRAMLVGQAPGQVERESGRPFSGRAGRTLFKWLAEAGASESRVREQIYIAAITRCYPGPSASGRGDRVPSAEEQSTCATWLEAELSLVRPRLIIAVGRLAIDRFLGRLPLERVIGKEHDVRMGGRKVQIIPLPHPSGASSWIHGAGHAELLSGALDLLRTRLAETLYL